MEFTEMGTQQLHNNNNNNNNGDIIIPSLIVSEELHSEIMKNHDLMGDSIQQDYANSDLFDPEEFVSSGSGGSCSGGDEFDNVQRESATNSVSESDDEDDEDEEEDLDFLDEEEGSETEALFDPLFLKFRNLLDAKVDDAERFFDRGLLRPSKNVDVAIQTEINEEPTTRIAASCNKCMIGGAPSSSSSKFECGTYKVVETQTDNASASALLSSSREEPDCARAEIGKLRDARVPLIFERKKIDERLKAVKKVAGTTHLGSWEEKQLYELEEAIEAIDSAIEFKNEIICGRETILLDKLAPGQEKAELVTRLASLSVFDLQRLFCKFFVRVVELRFSSKKLERNVDKLEGEIEQMGRIINIYNKSLREKDEDHENRIKQLLGSCAKSPDGSKYSAHILWMTQELTKAKRKQHDFQRSLTELLVRHGYLLNGADYDVKVVLRVLGLDFEELQQAGHHHHHSSFSQRPKRTINQRRNAEPENIHSASSSSRRQHSSGYGHGSSSGGARSSSHHHVQQQHRQPSSSSSRNHREREWERVGHNKDRDRERDRDERGRERGHYSQSRQNTTSALLHHHGHGQTGHHHQQHDEKERTTEVIRHGKKLIIHPPNSSQ